MILELGWKEQGIMDSKPAETWSHQRSSGAESPLGLASSSLCKADRIRGEIFCSFSWRSKVICPYSLCGLSFKWLVETCSFEQSLYLRLHWEKIYAKIDLYIYLNENMSTYPCKTCRHNTRVLLWCSEWLLEHC